MKIFFLVVFVCSFTVSVAQTEDEAAIKKLSEKFSADYIQSNFEAMANA